MCRTKGEGGRRCPGCSSARARKAHNARRRQNRQLRAQAVQQAAELGVPAADVDGLRSAHMSTVTTFLDLCQDTQWRARAQAAFRAAGTDPEEQGLLGPVSGVRTLSVAGANDSVAVDLPQGEGVFKPVDGSDEDLAADYGHVPADLPLLEVGAWRLARSLGGPYAHLVPACVLRLHGGQVGSLARFRPGQHVPYGHLNPILATRVDPASVDAAAFFDAVSGQQDRHRGNLLIADGQVVLIDHGYGFARTTDPLVDTDLLDFRIAAGRDQVNPAETALCERLLTRADTGGLVDLLGPDQIEGVRARALTILRTGRLSAVRDLHPPPPDPL